MKTLGFLEMCKNMGMKDAQGALAQYRQERALIKILKGELERLKAEAK